VKLEEAFIILIPTLDGTGNMELPGQIGACAFALKSRRIPVLVIQDKVGVAACRYMATEKIASHFGLQRGDAFRALMIDSDQSIDNPEVLAEYIDRADSEDANFVCPIRLKGPQEDVYSGGWSVDPDANEDWAEVEPKGIGGLYYGTLFVGYPWRQDPYASEDVNFLRDNPSVKVRFAKKVKVDHFARVKLSGYSSAASRSLALPQTPMSGHKPQVGPNPKRERLPE
jgi:hypothetical protein